MKPHLSVVSLSDAWFALNETLMQIDAWFALNETLMQIKFMRMIKTF